MVEFIEVGGDASIPPTARPLDAKVAYEHLRKRWLNKPWARWGLAPLEDLSEKKMFGHHNEI
jgi:hypothetical protein